MQLEGDYYDKSVSLSNDEDIWIGQFNQGHPVPKGFFKGYEILEPSEDEEYVQFRRVDGQDSTYCLPEGLFHRGHKIEASHDYLEDRNYQHQNPWSNEFTKHEILTEKYPSHDRSYHELDSFLLKPPSLLEVLKPAFRNLGCNISRGWYRMLERFNIRLKFDPSASKQSAHNL